MRWLTAVQHDKSHFVHLKTCTHSLAVPCELVDYPKNPRTTPARTSLFDMQIELDTSQTPSPFSHCHTESKLDKGISEVEWSLTIPSLANKSIHLPSPYERSPSKQRLTHSQLNRHSFKVKESSKSHISRGHLSLLAAQRVQFRRRIIILVTSLQVALTALISVQFPCQPQKLGRWRMAALAGSGCTGGAHFQACMASCLDALAAAYQSLIPSVTNSLLF